MKKLLLILGSLLAVAPVRGQVVPTPAGARITLDSVTTEIIVYSPDLVRVIKYVGDRPKLAGCPALKIRKGDPRAGEYLRSEGHHKYMVNTGRFLAAVNDRDGNVSFWDYEERLILAEQHKTGRLGAPVRKKRLREAGQDFQFGRAAVDSIRCDASADRPNLLDRVVRVGDAGLPSSAVSTEKGWSLVWNSALPATLDARREREGHKQGDVTFTSAAATAIDYFFCLK